MENLRIFRKRRRWTWFHVTAPRLKHEENSNHGDVEAKHRGLDGNSHDMQKDLNGLIWNTHWQDVFRHDGFIDSYGSLKPGDLLKHMEENEIRRLVAVTNGKRYHMRTEVEAINHCGKIGLKLVDAEAKAGNHWTVSDFRMLKRTAKKAGIQRFVISSMQRGILAKAKLSGCRVRLIKE